MLFDWRVDPSDAVGVLLGLAAGTHGDEKVVEEQLALFAHVDEGGPAGIHVGVHGQVEVLHIVGDGHGISFHDLMVTCGASGKWV